MAYLYIGQVSDMAMVVGANMAMLGRKIFRPNVIFTILSRRYISIPPRRYILSAISSGINRR